MRENNSPNLEKGSVIEEIISEIAQYPFPKSCISKKDERWNTYNKAYNKAIDDVKEFLRKEKSMQCIQSIQSIFHHAVEVLKNNEAGLIIHGHIPKKVIEEQKLLKADFHGRFDEIGLLYSDIFDISFNDAISELEIVEELEE